ncbi:AAA family ATPase [Xanthomonas campestris pv. raphani]|uniref:AAA family ATPase n=1 Tax=Xanthomonas campestris TaxID=339 RepID=UPI002B22EE0C|nr:AAA family ATPase [Xanthomonas campestris]MEA9755531.1 AAA family ATPase [Xanthomonas campestris pv. raphani]MEA9961516.1 AAA family ATPase [Xanthomonas campestris pv. raphani]
MASNLRVGSVSIEGLFGIYDHHVELRSGQAGTIIHGPNGVGKTVLLNCVSALFNGTYQTLRQAAFRKLTVKLSDGSNYQVNRDDRTDGMPPSLNVIITLADNQIYTFDLSKTSTEFESAALITERVPWLQDFGDGDYLDEREGHLIQAEEVVRRYGQKYLSESEGDEPQQLRLLRSRVRIKFIETNRLYHFNDNEKRSRSGRQSIERQVSSCAVGLRRQILQAVANYGRQSQRLDQSFPHRLVKEDFVPLSSSELKLRLEQLESRQLGLSAIGLLETEAIPPLRNTALDNLADEKRVPMTLFLRDNEEKIESLKGLAERITLLLGSINRKFRNKELIVSREDGLIARGPRGNQLPLDALSSGEQHEIVLIYELLFNIPRDTLVLIDEPELSLHVTWQRAFLPELMEFATKIGFYSIIATHSPFIVGNRTDLMVPLDAEPDDIDNIHVEL